MNENFDPKKIIDFSKDYYLILGIEKNILPNSNTREDKIKTSKIIEDAFRKKARKCHPDFGGSKEQFLDIVRARRILEDNFLRKIYDQGFFESNIDFAENSLFEVDWSKIGNYRKGTPEDSVGFSLFFKISDQKNNLNLTPAFFPSKEEHNYEWDWVINGTDSKLVLSIVNDENEVLRLTSSEKIDESLPFKIYICIPKKNLSLRRKQNAVYDPQGKTLISGSIENVSYNDYNLLETTNLIDAKKYIEFNLHNVINLFKQGKLKPENNSDTKWLDTEEIKKFDKLQLQNILNMKSFDYTNDEKAANFIDEINEKKSEKLIHDKPELPF
jgi:curved DNA-binding protein CbpA